MSEVKRYDAVHLRYEDSNIRYGEGCEIEVVTARDYAALEAECERLRVQVAALQSDANSWQSGYDKGRDDGEKSAEGWKAQHARDSAELRRLCSERDALREGLKDADSAMVHYMGRCKELSAELEAIKGKDAIAWQLRPEHQHCGLVRYMTQAKYAAQVPSIQKWYQPFRCGACSALPPAKADEVSVPRDFLTQIIADWEYDNDKYGLARELRALLASGKEKP